MAIDTTPNYGTQNPVLGGSYWEDITHFDETMEGIYNLERNFGTEFMYFVTALSNYSSQPTNHPQYLMNTKRRPRKVRVAQILTRTANGDGTLTLTLNDSTIVYFRVKETVIDNGGSFRPGLVIAKSAGSITIEPLGGTAAFASSDFAAQEWLTSGWTVGGNTGSTGVEEIFRYGDVQEDYASVQRETFGYDTNTKVTKKAWGTAWYDYHESEAQAFQRYYEGMAKKMIYSEVGSGVNSHEGLTSNTRGIYQGMRQDGLSVSLSSAPSLQDIEDMVMFTSQVRGDWEKDITINLSNAMKMYINNNFGNDYIKYAGSVNTFGGNAVMGNNIELYTFGSIKVKFMQWMFMNDGVQFPSPTTISGLGNATKNNYRFFVGSWAPIPSVQTEGTIEGTNMLPVMRKIHFANDAGESWEKPVVNVIQGMGPNRTVVSSPVPADTHAIMSINGLAGIFDTFAIAEVAN